MAKYLTSIGFPLTSTVQLDVINQLSTYLKANMRWRGDGGITVIPGSHLATRHLRLAVSCRSATNINPKDLA